MRCILLQNALILIVLFFLMIGLPPRYTLFPCTTLFLSINLANVTVTATDTDAVVNEAGLPGIGSDAASNSEIFNGSITTGSAPVWNPFTLQTRMPSTSFQTIIYERLNFSVTLVSTFSNA